MLIDLVSSDDEDDSPAKRSVAEGVRAKNRIGTESAYIVREPDGATSASSKSSDKYINLPRSITTANTMATNTDREGAPLRDITNVIYSSSGSKTTVKIGIHKSEPIKSRIGFRNSKNHVDNDAEDDDDEDDHDAFSMKLKPKSAASNPISRKKRTVPTIPAASQPIIALHCGSSSSYPASSNEPSRTKKARQQTEKNQTCTPLPAEAAAAPEKHNTKTKTAKSKKAAKCIITPVRIPPPAMTLLTDLRKLMQIDKPLFDALFEAFTDAYSFYYTPSEGSARGGASGCGSSSRSSSNNNSNNSNNSNSSGKQWPYFNVRSPFQPDSAASSATTASVVRLSACVKKSTSANALPFKRSTKTISIAAAGAEAAAFEESLFRSSVVLFRWSHMPGERLVDADTSSVEISNGHCHDAHSASIVAAADAVVAAVSDKTSTAPTTTRADGLAATSSEIEPFVLLSILGDAFVEQLVLPPSSTSTSASTSTSTTADDRRRCGIEECQLERLDAWMEWVRREVFATHALCDPRARIVIAVVDVDKSALKYQRKLNKEYAKATSISSSTSPPSCPQVLTLAESALVYLTYALDIEFVRCQKPADLAEYLSTMTRVLHEKECIRHKHRVLRAKTAAVAATATAVAAAGGDGMAKIGQINNYPDGFGCALSSSQSQSQSVNLSQHAGFVVENPHSQTKTLTQSSSAGFVVYDDFCITRGMAVVVNEDSQCSYVSNISHTSNASNNSYNSYKSGDTACSMESNNNNNNNSSVDNLNAGNSATNMNMHMHGLHTMANQEFGFVMKAPRSKPEEGMSEREKDLFEKRETWAAMLQMIPQVSREKAKSIVYRPDDKFSCPAKLFHAFNAPLPPPPSSSSSSSSSKMVANPITSFLLHSNQLCTTTNNNNNNNNNCGNTNYKSNSSAVRGMEGETVSLFSRVLSGLHEDEGARYNNNDNNSAAISTKKNGKQKAKNELGLQEGKEGEERKNTLLLQNCFGKETKSGKIKNEAKLSRVVCRALTSLDQNAPLDLS